MKHYKIVLFIMLSLSFSSYLAAQHAVYTLSFSSGKGEYIPMSRYKDKKILIVVAGPDALQANASAKYLGDIQKEYPDVTVIIIPIADSGVSMATDTLTDVANTDRGALVTTAESSRHPLLQWLSDSKQNLHFDVTLKHDEQFFVISASGVLYAVLEKGVPDAVLKEVLTAKDVEPQQVITDINRQGYTPPR